MFPLPVLATPGHGRCRRRRVGHLCGTRATWPTVADDGPDCRGRLRLRQWQTPPLYTLPPIYTSGCRKMHQNLHPLHYVSPASFASSYTWMQDNLREAVITPLRAAVFMHVSRQSRVRKAWPILAQWQICSVLLWRGFISARDLDILIRRLTPTSLALLDDSVLLKKREFRASLEPGVHKEMPVGCRGSTCLPLLLGYAGCADDIERFESEQSHRFQLVVRARPDLLWHCRLPEAPPMVDRGGTFTYRDWFAVFSRDVALNALRLQERIAQPQPCQTRSPVHEQLICMDSVLAERKANWCELGRWHSHNGQHLRPTKSDEQSADAPVEIQRETLSGLPKGGGRAVPPQKTCRLCRPSRRRRIQSRRRTTRMCTATFGGRC